MQIDQIENFFFQPPLAIARLGGSDKPLDCFVWDSDRSIHGGNRTVIRPAPTLKVIADGSLRPYLPNVIQFRDGDQLRPVAPFFELWATVSDADGHIHRVAVNLEFLRTVGAQLDGVEYTITVANRKAQRRTLKASCAFIARAVVSGTDHERKPLKAYSPHNPGEEPLVSREHPIHLGDFQVINPLEQKAMGIDLSVLRVRFTPATGQVYGPRTAIAGPASPLQPGDALPAVTLGGRLHEIVPESNRKLNPHTPWSSSYVMDAHDQQDPQPSDSYDGANVGSSHSWGVVDDSCDGIIEARVVIKGVRHVARARVLSSCPDFAPDRRPFNSFADDLADRGLPAVTVSDDTKEQTESEIVDLFERAYETASLMNLDATRTRAIVENLPAPDKSAYRSPPHVDYRSMTAGDHGYAEITAQLFPAPSNPETPPASPPDPSVDPTPYGTAAHFVHGPLCDIDTLLHTLVLEYDRIERLIRPPFGRLSNLPTEQRSNHKYRDPRVTRDGYHDMRMPPYMRDSDQNPLSITYRQYGALLELMALEKLGRHGPNSKKTDTPSRRRIAQFRKRYWKAPKEKVPKK
jgi:hypothetical protein